MGRHRGFDASCKAKVESPQVKESLNLLATECRVQCAFHGFMYLYSMIDVYGR